MTSQLASDSKTSRLLIASDHAGFSLKSAIIHALPELHWIDLGPPSTERVDYPDYAAKLCKELLATQTGLGVLICGSGIGVSITANRFKGIRAALVENPVSARLAREHNHANVLCLGSRFLAPEYAAEILKSFLSASPDPDPRHLARIQKMETF